MISFEEVQLELLDRDYQLTEFTKKKAAYRFGDASPLYVNRTSASGKTSLIVHPEASIDKLATSIDGLLVSGDWYHSSNMRMFPKRLNRGKKETHYGRGLTFESYSALGAVLDFLEGAVPSPAPDTAGAASIFPGRPGYDMGALAKRRVGHSAFKDQLIQYWKRCAVSGSACMSLLRASHIMPWEMSSPVQKTDSFNGLLLAPNFDAAFDIGLISFEDTGALMLSPKLSTKEQSRLGFSPEQGLSKVDPRHIPYLVYHRNTVFQR